MKLAFWLIGETCAGKSTYSKILAEKLNTKWLSLDTVNDRLSEGMTKRDAYNHIFKDSPDTIIVDGIIPLSYSYDMEIVLNCLKDYEIIYVVIKPRYKKWLQNIEARKIEIPGSNPKIKTSCDYNNYYEQLTYNNAIARYLIIENKSDLAIISLEQIRNLNYQHNGFTDVKFKQLQINCKDKHVLDLGCSSCQFEPMFMAKGAKTYRGLDVNLSYLIRKNAQYFNINNLENYNYKHDIVVCSSVMHYIHDKEKFIKECSRIAKELCVLEIPLDKGPGRYLHLGSRGLYFPTKLLFEDWISKYFKTFKCIGNSIVEDGSYRLIYHCINCA